MLKVSTSPFGQILGRLLTLEPWEGPSLPARIRSERLGPTSRKSRPAMDPFDGSAYGPTFGGLVPLKICTSWQVSRVPQSTVLLVAKP